MFQALGPLVCQESPEKHVIGKLMTRKYGGEDVDRPLRMGEKKVEIFVSHVSAHQKDISADRWFSHQVNRMACSVGTSQLLSPVTAITAHRAREQRSRGGWVGGSSQAQPQGLPVTKVHMVMPAPSAQSTSRQGPRHGTITRNDHQPPGGRLMTLNPARTEA